MNQELQRVRRKPITIFIIILAFAGLALSYLLQEIDLLASICHCSFHPHVHFIAKKVIRVIVNDTCLLLIIHSWFDNKNITRIAWRVQLIDTLLLLPIYLSLKLTLEGVSELSSPLLSQLHRLIVNPTLMILIIPAVYFQRLRNPK